MFNKTIFFIAVALTIQGQTQATEQIEKVVESTQVVVAAADYSIIKGLSLVTGCALVGTCIGIGLWGTTWVVTVLSQVASYAKFATAILPKFMQGGLAAASHTAGSVMLYAFENALTTVAGAGACLAGWKVGGYVAKKLGVDPIRDPQTYLAIRIVCALIGLAIPMVYAHKRTQSHEVSKEVREDYDYAKKLAEIQDKKGYFPINRADRKRARRYAHRPKSMVHLTTYIAVYMVILACTAVGVYGTGVAWKERVEGLQVDRDWLLGMIREKKRRIASIWSYETGLQVKPVNRLAVVAEDDEVDPLREMIISLPPIDNIDHDEDRPKLAKEDQELSQLQEVTVPLDKEEQKYPAPEPAKAQTPNLIDEEPSPDDVNHDDERPAWAKDPNFGVKEDEQPSQLQEVIVSLDEEEQKYPATEPVHEQTTDLIDDQLTHRLASLWSKDRKPSTPQPIEELQKRLEAFPIQQRFLSPSVEPLHPDYAESNRQEELHLLEQTPEVVRNLALRQYSPVKFLIECLEVGEYKVAEACIRKYASEFDTVPNFPKEYYEGDEKGLPSLLGLALIAASREGYQGLATLLISDKEMKKRLPSLKNNEGYNAVQLAVMGGHEVIANRLTGQSVRALIADVLKKREAKIKADAQTEVVAAAKAKYDEVVAAAKAKCKEAIAIAWDKRHEIQSDKTIPYSRSFGGHVASAANATAANTTYDTVVASAKAKRDEAIAPAKAKYDKVVTAHATHAKAYQAALDKLGARKKEEKGTWGFQRGKGRYFSFGVG